MLNWLGTLGLLVIGIIVGSVLEVKTGNKYERKCLNCQHYLIKGPLGDSKLMTGMCQHSMSFRDMPLTSSYYCGKFEFTDELKGEIIREGLNREYKTGKLHFLKSNNGEQTDEKSNNTDDDRRSVEKPPYPADEDGEDNGGASQGL